MHKSHSPQGTQRNAAQFWLLFVILVWLAHALGYLVHEYAHTVTAWVLGCKANPLALTYGHLTAKNLLFLSDIDENVDYDQILAAGRAPITSLIAVAGVLFGNVLFYFISRRLFSFAKARNLQILGLFAFLLCLMNVGNFLDYVPVRTFTSHSDMARVEEGLRISPWWIVTILGTPFAVAIWHFFARLLPDARTFLFHQRKVSQVILVVLSSFTMFVYFGSAGMHGYGETSHWISVASLCVLFPVVIILCWPHKTERNAVA